MSQHLTQGPVVVADTTVTDLNQAFTAVQEQIDALKGLRGRARIHDRLAVADDEQPEDAVNQRGVAKKAQDAVGGILVDTPSLDFTYDGTVPAISAVFTGLIEGTLEHTGTLVGFFGVAPAGQVAVLADAVTAHTITAPADAPASADALRDDLVANTLPSIVSALNALGVKMNAMIDALQAHGLMGT